AGRLRGQRPRRARGRGRQGAAPRHRARHGAARRHADRLLARARGRGPRRRARAQGDRARDRRGGVVRRRRPRRGRAPRGLRLRDRPARDRLRTHAAGAAQLRGDRHVPERNTAAELAAALGRAVELPPAPAGVTVTVRLTRDGRPATDGASVRLVSSVGDGEHALREAGPGLFQAEVPAGSYSAVVADAFADAPLTFAGLAVAEGEANEFAFELALTVSPA